MVRNQWHSRYLKISTVRSVFIYSEILYSGKCTVVIALFFPFHRMKEDFMELYLVREKFQSDMCLVR